MKKLVSILSVLLVIILALTLSACGKDGVTPTIEISEDGYWIINGVKTESKAVGTDGKDGIDGKDGVDGTPGKDGADGKDGATPAITISEDGYWVINGEKTNVKASPDENVDENPQGLQFYKQDDGTYIVACGDAKYLSNIVIPATYKGGAVVGIDLQAFYGCTSLASITIPDSVISIGGGAFAGCTSLTSMTIGDSVESIEDSAFQGCTSLASITIPDSVISIGESAFYGCTSLTSVTIGDSVERIENYAFSGCTSLASITIPNSVISIGYYVFYGCTSLTTINFEGTVEQWNAISKERYWFSRDPATEVVCSDGVVSLR